MRKEARGKVLGEERAAGRKYAFVFRRLGIKLIHPQRPRREGADEREDAQI